MIYDLRTEKLIIPIPGRCNVTDFNRMSSCYFKGNVVRGNMHVRLFCYML